MTMSTASEQGPVCILRPSADHHALEEVLAGMATLEALPGELAVVAIAGNQRGGKSTLMNLLHGRSLSGFQMGHYLDPKTSGLWVWPRPHPYQEGVTILLVDTEGLDSPHVPHHYNWLLSAITLLASDVFMYQSRGSIEQSAGERLDMILRIAAQLSRTSSDGELPEHPASTFLWLLRDHQLRMRCSPREELLGKLDPSALQTLRRCFNDSDCVLLPRPAHSDEDLRKLDELSYNDLSEEFREEYVVLERRLFGLLSKPRRILGGALTGATLVSCLRSFVTATHGKGGFIEDIRSLPSQRELLLQVGGERAVQAALSAYKASMSSEGVLPNSAALLEAHAKAQQVAETAFEVEAKAVGLLASDWAPFKALCTNRIAEWEAEAPSPDWPANTLLRDGGAALLGGEIESIPFSKCPLTLPVLSRRGGVLKSGLLHEIWEKHARSSATAANQATTELLGLLQHRLEVTCGASSGSCFEPFTRVEEVWMELHKVQDAMMPERNEEIALSPGANTPSSGSSLAFWGAAAGDRVTLSLARSHAAMCDEVLRTEVREVRDELRNDAQGKFDDLDASVTTRAAEQAAALRDLEERQATVIQEVRVQGEGRAEEARNAVTNLEASCKAMTAETRSELKITQETAVITAQKMQAEVESQLRVFDARLSERLGAQRDELVAAEARLKDVLAVAKRELQVETVGLGKEFREGVQELQERADLSSKSLWAELHELEKRREAAQLETRGLLDTLKSHHETCTVDLQREMESYRTNLKNIKMEAEQQLQEAEKRWQQLMTTLQGDLSELHSAFQKLQVDIEQKCREEEVHRQAYLVEMKQKLQEAQEEQKQPIAALQASVGEQNSALGMLRTELQQQLHDEQGHRKSGLMEIQKQLQQFEQQQKPIAEIQSSLAEQHSSLETLQTEMRTLFSADVDRKSGMADLHQKMEAIETVSMKVGQEVRNRLITLESQCESVRMLDLDGLQKELKLQKEQMDLATTLCRNAKTASERIVAAILTGSAFLGCSQLLALARPMGLYTIALPLLAAGGYHCGRRGYTLQQAIDTLPASWQPFVRSCWVRMAQEIQQRGLKPLTQATKDIGLDQHARSCVSAVANGAGKLKRRLVANSENDTPSNIETAAPSPKRARVSETSAPILAHVL